MAFPVSTLFQNAKENSRADEKVKIEIRSGNASFGMDVLGRLKECATSDPRHILRPNNGPHVAMVHQALEKIGAAALAPVSPAGVPSGPSDKDARQFNDAVRALRQVLPIAAAELSLPLSMTSSEF